MPWNGRDRLQHAAPEGRARSATRSSDLRGDEDGSAWTKALRCTASMAGAAGLVWMGGPMSVYEAERFPHLLPELRLIEEALDAELPILGVCSREPAAGRRLGRACVLVGPEGDRLGPRCAWASAARKRRPVARRGRALQTWFHRHGMSSISQRRDAAGGVGDDPCRPSGPARTPTVCCFISK